MFESQTKQTAYYYERYNAPGKCTLVTKVQVQIRVPFLQSRDQLHEALLKVLIGNNRIEIALSGAILQFRNSILEADLDLLCCFRVAPGESLLQVQDGRRLDEQVLAVQVGALDALHALYVDVKDAHLAQRSDLQSKRTMMQ